MSMDENDDAAIDALVEAEVEALRGEYRKSIPEKIRELDHALADNQVANLRVLAHKARGSAGSYGFQDLSKAFAEVEEAAIAIENGDTSQWQTIRNSLQRLKNMSGG